MASTSAIAGTRPRAVILDAGNTLVFVDPEVLFATLASAGIPGAREAYPEAEFRARARLAAGVQGGLTGTEAHVWREYFATLFLGVGVPADRLEEVGLLLKEVHERDHLWTHVQPGTREALEAVREAGYRLGVISNSDGRVEALLRRVGLADLMEFILDSELLGVEKPDPRIFLRGCALMGLAPGECLYVGDLFPVDVLGARAAGLQALLLDPLDRLELPADRIPSVRELPAYLERWSAPRANGGGR